MKVIKKIKIFLKEVFNEIDENKLTDSSAALSFKALLAIVPAFALIGTVLGTVLGKERVLSWIFSRLEIAFGAEVVLLEQAVEGTFAVVTGFIFSSIFFIIAVWSSVSLIHYARRVFFSIFNVEISGYGKIKKTVKSRLISFLYTLLLFALFVLLILGQGLVAIVSTFLVNMTDAFNIPITLKFINYALFFSLVSLVFGLIYWFMSAGTLHFRSIFWGSILSSVFFIVFNFLLSFYVSYSFTIGLYGASSFIIVLLIWIYYSSFTLFLGGLVAFIINKRIEKNKGKKKPVYI